MECGAPLVDVTNGVRERLRIDVLEQVAGRARGHRGEDLCVVREASEHQHTNPRRDLDEPSKRADAVALGHHEVEQHHIGGDSAGDIDCLCGARRLADDLNAILESKKTAQSLTNDSVVVNDEQADRRGHSVRPPDADGDRGATTGARADVELRADFVRALAHRHEPHATSRARQRRHVEARSVVFDA